MLIDDEGDVVSQRRAVRRLKHPVPIVLTGPEYERWLIAKERLGVREDSIALVRLLDVAGLADVPTATAAATAAIEGPNNA